MITQRTAVLGVLAVLGVILFQMANVISVDHFAPTIFGDMSVGIYWSTPELFLLVAVAFLFGEGAAAGVILTSLGLSFAVEDPALISATIGSKLVALAAVWAARRFGAGFLLSCLIALQVDVVAFALWAGIPSIIWSAFAIRLALWGALALVVTVAVHRKGGAPWKGLQPSSSPSPALSSR